MFDIGFWELALIGVVALLIVGPERLPALARTVGFWLGKARRLMSNVREDIERELRAEELKKMTGGKAGLDDIRDSLQDTTRTLQETSRELSSDVDSDSRKSEPARPSPTPPAQSDTADAETPPARPSTHDER